MKTISSIHYRYIIFILSLIIISLLTFKYAPETSLFNYVAFAATISSLILAILAIIQGFLSSDSISNTVTNLNDSSNKIIDSSKQLSNIINDLDKKVDEIPILLKGIDSKLNKTTEFLNPINQGKQTKEPKVSKDLFDHLITSSSPIGILSLYAIILSFKSKKEFSFSDLKNEPYTITTDYNYGFIIACHCLSLITIQTSNAQTIEVLKIDDRLKNAENVFDLFLSNTHSTNHKEKLLIAKLSIEQFFDNM